MEIDTAAGVRVYPLMRIRVSLLHKVTVWKDSGQVVKVRVSYSFLDANVWRPRISNHVVRLRRGRVRVGVRAIARAVIRGSVNIGNPVGSRVRVCVMVRVEGMGPL